jgi:hypothetical protein
VIFGIRKRLGDLLSFGNVDYKLGLNLKTQGIALA